MTPVRTATLGRAAGEVAGAVRRMILSGKVAANQFLPSERALAAEYNVDKKTISRALQALAGEGLVAAVDRHGYRILARGDETGPGGRLAYVPPSESGEAIRRVPGRLILPALRDAADRRGWSLLAVGSQRPPQAILAELREVGVSGVVLDNDRPEIIAALDESGISTIAVDAWRDDSPFDAVIQDGQEGGMLAVRFLLDAGCRRIAWLGPDQVSPHATDRFSGVAATLFDAGLDLPASRNIRVGETGVREALRRVLAGPERPDGICALWMGLICQAESAVREAGLQPGLDVRLVGWTPEEAYGGEYLQMFEGGGWRPPAVAWSARAMAETAIARLMERRQNPDLPPVRIRLPMKLLPGSGRPG